MATWNMNIGKVIETEIKRNIESRKKYCAKQYEKQVKDA